MARRATLPSPMTVPPQRRPVVSAGVRVDIAGLTRTTPRGTRVLQDVSFSVLPGELVAIVGASGAGKTTLLEALAGVHPADAGCVRFDGVDVAEHLDLFRSVLGYVPQDDIVHTELTLARTLRYAASLRLPVGTTSAQMDAAVARVLEALELTKRADVRVSALSGGQRKRASIAVELLTEPHVFFLDEPTSGLDPLSGNDLLRVLRGLSDGGATVVFTTHAVQDLAACDRIVVLAPGGYLAFQGSLPDALTFFAVDSVADIYRQLAAESAPGDWAQRFAAHPQPQTPELTVTTPLEEVSRGRVRPGRLRQFAVLSARTFETLTRNRLTLAILLGSPVLV